jgi:polyisoprenoid-binding protein YceI
MKRFALVMLLFCTSTANAADTVGVADTKMPLDVKASQARFSVKHILIERVSGSIPIVSADIEVGADGLTPTSVDATLDPSRIDTGDSDRDGALTGSDWFDTKRFPLWTFKSDRIIANPDKTYSISGTLTIHGVGIPVTLATVLVRKAPYPLYHATTIVDRHAFGMVVTRTDPLIGNDVAIDLDIQAK